MGSTLQLDFPFVLAHVQHHTELLLQALDGGPKEFLRPDLTCRLAGPHWGSSQPASTFFQATSCLPGCRPPSSGGWVATKRNPTKWAGLKKKFQCNFSVEKSFWCKEKKFGAKHQNWKLKKYKNAFLKLWGDFNFKFLVEKPTQLALGFLFACFREPATSSLAKLDPQGP